MMTIRDYVMAESLEQAVRQEFGAAGEKQAAISLVHTRSVDLCPAQIY